MSWRQDRDTLKSFRPRVVSVFLAVLVGATVFPLAAPAYAQEPSLQEIFDDFFGIDAVDASQDTGLMLFPAGTWTFSAVAEFTSSQNIFGWYPADNPTQLHPLLDFLDVDPGASTTVDIPADFGIYINSRITGGSTFKSQADLNGDGTDHFRTFDAPDGGIAVGIEDLPGGGDADYQDDVLLMTPGEGSPITKATLTVDSVDLSGEPVNVWAVVRSADGAVLKTGFTPLDFTGIFGFTLGNTLKVSVANYDGKVFDHWQDKSIDQTRSVVLTGDTTLTAVYDTGDSLRGYSPLTYAGTEADLSVNATSAGGEELNMWMVIDPQSTNASGTTYKVYATDSYQSFVFDHWDDGSTDRIRTLTIREDTEIVAFYAGPQGALVEKTFGSEENESVSDVATHFSGVYVTGATAGTLPGQTSAGDNDAFIIKFDSVGNELWTVQFGTPESDGASALAVNDSGIYVIGPGIGIQKFDHDGNHVWTTQIADAVVEAVAADELGVYVVGETGVELAGSSKVGPEDWTAGPLFLKKLDPATGDSLYTVQWGVGETLFGDEVPAVEIGALPTVTAVDAFSGSVYVAGQGWPDGSFSPHPGAADAHVDKFDAGDGSYVWSEFLGAPRANAAEVQAGPQGIFLAGTCCVAPGAASGTGAGYISKFDEDGNQVFARELSNGESVISGIGGIAVTELAIYATGGMTQQVPEPALTGFFLKKFDLDGNELASIAVSLYPVDVAASSSALYVVGATSELPPGLASDQLDGYLRIYPVS